MKKINWKKIIEKYPNSINEYFIWISKGKIKDFTEWVEEFVIGKLMTAIEGRNFYDFFDSHKIRGIVYASTNGTFKKSITLPKDNNDMAKGWDIDRFWIEGYDTRIEAELSLWDKCFEILERKIRNNTT